MSRALNPTDYKRILKLMAEGALKATLLAELDSSERQFDKLLKEDINLLETYEKGLQKCEAFYVAERKRLYTQEGRLDKDRLKYVDDILDKQFKWAKKDIEALGNTQINIGNMTVHQNKTRDENLEFIKDALIDQGIIDLNESEYKLIESGK